jgi:hypothetical protein
MQTEKGIAIIGGVGIGLLALPEMRLPKINYTTLMQPKPIQQSEEFPRVDLMALISQVGYISETSHKLAHHISNFRAQVIYRRVHTRVVSGWVIKDFLRKRNGYTRISKCKPKEDKVNT